MLCICHMLVCNVCTYLCVLGYNTPTHLHVHKQTFFTHTSKHVHSSRQLHTLKSNNYIIYYSLLHATVMKFVTVITSF